MQALQSELPDFEDAVQEQSAQKEQLAIIITRNTEDFKKSNLEIHRPESFLKQLHNSQTDETEEDRVHE